MIEKPYHGGNPPESVTVDFSSNLHPEPAPASVMNAAAAGVAESGVYPDGAVANLRRKISDLWKIPAEQIFLTSGSSALLYHLFAALRPTSVVLPVPCFSEYPFLASLGGARVLECAARPEGGWRCPPPPDFPAGAYGLMSNPCNPTGRLADPEILDRWIRSANREKGGLILDEAYADFVDPEDMIGPAELLNRGVTAILRSPAKFFGLPGLRIGVGCVSKDLAEQIRSVMPPWSMSTPACWALDEILKLDPALLAARRRRLRSWTSTFQKALITIPGVNVFTSDVHYFLMRLDLPGMNGFDLSESLLSNDIWIRTSRGMPGLTDRDIRVSTQLPEENGRLIQTLKRVLNAADVSV